MLVQELPIPTYYGDEICYVNGIRYAWNVIKATLKSRLHDLSIFYDSKFDCGHGHDGNGHSNLKLGFESPPHGKSGSSAHRSESAGYRLCRRLHERATGARARLSEHRRRQISVGRQCSIESIHPTGPQYRLSRYYDLRVRRDPAS